MKRRLFWLAPLAALLIGCGGAEPPGEPIRGAQPVEGLREVEVVLNDGRRLFCVYAAEFREGGITCDWAAAEGPR